MKKIIFLLSILILLISQDSNSQTDFGLKAGPNLAKYSGTLAGADYKYKVGFFIGGYGNIGINEKFKIQPEILFALHGTQFVTEEIQLLQNPGEEPVTGSIKTKTTETTIQVPIMAQYYLAEKFYLEAGPQIGFILNRKEELIESPYEDPDFNEIRDIEPDTFDLGLALGTGYDLGENISLNFRYFFGLIERDLAEIKSSVLNVGIEYEF